MGVIEAWQAIVLSKPLRVTETAERVALGLYLEDTAVESQQLFFLM